jgi:protein gp37
MAKKMIESTRTNFANMIDIANCKMKNWNPVIGCLHSCSYCWAKRFAQRLSSNERYKDGLNTPKIIETELDKRFRNQFVGVSMMGDLFGQWVPTEWILKVNEATRNSPSSDFLMLTKNPKRFKEFAHFCRDNVLLGTTIESNRSYDFSKAPPVNERAHAMTELSFKRKFVSVEPILDFDIDAFADTIEKISPEIVAVGYDNWNNSLPEPPLAKTLQLIDRLEMFTTVRKRTLRDNRVMEGREQARQQGYALNGKKVMKIV